MNRRGLLQLGLQAGLAGLGLTRISDSLAADDWNTVVAKAKQEGVVVVHGGPGKAYENALMNEFMKAFPEIKVQFSGAAGAIETPKVLRERQAGIYAWDVWVSGPTGALSQLKPAGFFQPLRKILRPEITDDSKWMGGFDFGWTDLGRELFYGFDGTLQVPILVNWDFVQRSSFTSLEDLLTPALAGKIVWHDPRVNGTGNGTSQTLFRNLGAEKLVGLMRNKVTFTTNGHQIAEWLVRGRYPIAIGIEVSDLEEFRKVGLGKNISRPPETIWKTTQISTGFGGVGLIDRAPHPNAAAVYINWLLSREGQEAFTKIPRNSRRTDVAPAFQDLVPLPGKTYFVGQAEENSEERIMLLGLSKQAIDGK